MNRLDYAIVIATRNRPAALRLSIPRMLRQSRPPAQLIVVDASDDHEASAAAARDAAAGHEVELVVRRAEPSASAQRNLGVGLVDCPLVFFPDDDSIWFPGVAAAKLEVYERDVEGRVAAVCGAESPHPPEDWELPAEGGYEMRRSHRLQQRVAWARARLEKRWFPDPAHLLGQGHWPDAAELPDWFEELEVVLVEWMTGFRMSFRTEVIREVRFDETLSRYSLFEDMDASLGAWRRGWVVGANRARIFHYRSPERRGDHELMGAIQVLNKAYVVAKNSRPGDSARRALARFTRYKELLYSLSRHRDEGRARLRGLRRARAQLAPLLATDSDEAAASAYRDALAASIS